MVKSKLLNSESIVAAMEAGEFYASSGVILSDVSRNKNDYYTVEVDQEQTLSLIGKTTVPLDVTIEFIGEKGKVIKRVRELSAQFDLKNLNSIYLRAKITVHHRGHHYHAWTQPYFQ